MPVPPWSRLARQHFDPQRALRGEELELFVGRPDDRLDRVVRELGEDPDGARKFFVTGTTGAGKSSELAEIGRRHWDTWAVIPVDVMASAANVNDVSGVEVIVMIGIAAVRCARAIGIEVPKERLDALMAAFRRMAKEPDRIDPDRLVRGVTTFAVSAAMTAGGLPVAGAIAPAVGEVAGAVVGRVLRPFGGLARAVADSDPEVDGLAGALAEILVEIARVRRPLVLVDGLDRIESPDVIRSVFVQNRLLELPTCPVLYAGPISLWADPDYRAVTGSGRFEDVPLANLPVQRPVPGFTEIEESKIQAAYATMRAVVALRLGRERLTPEEVFAAGVLDHLVTQSGGVIRDLVGLVQEAMRQASWADPVPAVISMELAQAAVREKQRSFEPGLTNARAVEALQVVEERGQPAGDELSSRLLLRGAILGYRNSRLYFRVHPLARSVLPAKPA